MPAQQNTCSKCTEGTQENPTKAKASTEDKKVGICVIKNGYKYLKVLTK